VLHPSKFFETLNFRDIMSLIWLRIYPLEKNLNCKFSRNL
jgi:hypothetical protein